MPYNPPLIPGEGDLLIAINHANSPILDAFMYMISNPGPWIPLIAVLLYYLFHKKPWQEGVLILLSIGLCILICDQLSSGFAKPYFGRPRPTHSPEFRDQLHIVYNYVGRQFGFFSGHASNFLACSIVLCYAIGRRFHSILALSLVALVAYSRMYQGVHFLSDILGGIVVGGMTGLGVSYLHRWLRCKFSPLGHKPSREVFSQDYQLWLGALIAFLPILISYSWQVAQIIDRFYN